MTTTATQRKMIAWAIEDARPMFAQRGVCSVEVYLADGTRYLVTREMVEGV